MTTLSIPELILPESSNITFSLTYENFLGNKGESFGTILTSGKTSPSVEILRDSFIFDIYYSN